MCVRLHGLRPAVIAVVTAWSAVRPPTSTTDVDHAASVFINTTRDRAVRTQTDTATDDRHVNFVLSQCSQRLYLLKLLRSQGLSTAQLDQVSQAIIVSRLRYALPVWSVFLTADLINRIQALLKRLFKFGYSSHLISFSDLIKSCSAELFENAHKSNHCLHELFFSHVHRLESLHPRGHDLMLPACTGYLHKQSFIIRSLFDFFFSFALLLFRSLFRSLEFVRLSHSLINTVLLCILCDNRTVYNLTKHKHLHKVVAQYFSCLLYTSPSPRD